MKSYFSTFVAGAGPIVEGALRKRDPAVNVTTLLDGLIVYQTDLAPGVLRNFRFFNNTFVLLEQYPQLSLQKVPATLRQLARNTGLVRSLVPYLPSRVLGFRIIVSHENQYAATDRAALRLLEARLQQGGKLRVSIEKPDTEFWLLLRREGMGLFGFRLTDERVKKLHPGELRPELSNILCLAAGLRQGDVVCDPFAGYGSIPIECAYNFPVREVLASDEDPALAAALKERVQKKSTIKVARMDAHALGYADGSVSRIITDPPWGIYMTIDDPDRFYRGILTEFARVLKKGGMAVVLMGNKEVFEAALAQVAALSLVRRHDILVSGKKAGIYVIRRD